LQRVKNKREEMNDIENGAVAPSPRKTLRRNPRAAHISGKIKEKVCGAALVEASCLAKLRVGDL
jgi:hypothetical protein